MDKRTVDYLRPIPDGFDIVYASQHDGEKTASGFTANEPYAMRSNTGEHVRLTWGRHWYNHFCTSPGGRFIAANSVDEDEQARSLHAVVVGTSRLNLARPREGEVAVRRTRVRGNPPRVVAHEPLEEQALLRVHARRRQTLRLGGEAHGVDVGRGDAERGLGRGAACSAARRGPSGR